MKNFLLRIICFLIPFFVVCIVYFITDPFRVLYTYDDLYKGVYGGVNRDYVSTEKFLKNYDKEKYNSFIFGSSRTLAFKTNYWVKHLPAGAKPFVFDASRESIFGIYKKFVLLEKMHVPVKNALLIFCPDATFIRDVNDFDIMYIKDPKISLESQLFFQYKFFEAYFTKFYFFNDIKNRLLNPPPGNLWADPITNDLYLASFDKQIKEDSIGYYKNDEWKTIVLNKTIDTTKSIITPKAEDMMKYILSVLKKNNTSYKIVISPLYNKLRFNVLDLVKIKNMFGAENVYDFSGSNDITNNNSNYYEQRHFKYFVGTRIMDKIYKNK